MQQPREIEWVLVGSRKYISREHLLEFIKANTHKGYYATKGYYAGR